MINNIQNFIKLLYYSSINIKEKIKIENINNLVPIIKRNRVTTMFYYGIDLLENNDLEAEEFNKLKKETIALGVISIYQDRAFNELVTKFNSENIRLIVFKGYVIKHLYAKKEMRAMGDIDFIVDKKDYSRARKIILEDLGYKLDHEDNSELCATNSQKVTIELHQHLVTELSNNQQYFDDTYQQHIVARDNYYTFDDNYHFIYMMDHIYKHFIDGGLGLKYIYDFALYVRQYPNVIKNTFDELKNLHLDKITLGFLQICNDYMDVDMSIQLSLFDKRVDKRAIDTLLKIMMKYGEYGTVESRVNAKNVHGTFFKRMKKRLFPIVIRPCVNRKIRYIHVIKEVVIYPFRLIFYWIRFVIKNFKYIINVFVRFSSLDEKNKDDLTNMYKEMK